MRVIKLSLAALAVLLTFGFASAQVGVQIGYNNSKNVNDKHTLTGFHAGLAYNMSIQGPISLQYGLLYNYLTGTNKFGTINVKTVAHRLDLPVRLAATFQLTNGIKAFVFGGPNFNYGLSQVNTYTGTITGFEASGKNIYTLDMNNGKKYFTPFDVQLGAGGGLQFNNLALRVGYDWGMLDRNNSDTSVWKNNDFKASLVYYF